MLKSIFKQIPPYKFINNNVINKNVYNNNIHALIKHHKKHHVKKVAKTNLFIDNYALQG
jgi:hypothetical protein